MVDSLQKYNAIRSQLANFHDKPFRKAQEVALRFIDESKRKHVVICAATGSGKSLAAVVAGMAYDNFTYLCSSRQLQRQLESDFPEARTIWGRGNFQCARRRSLTAAECVYAGLGPMATKEQKKAASACKARCPYEIKKKAVLAHRYRILNYQYFITEGNYVGQFTKNLNVVICDEADKLEQVLSSFIALRISGRMLRELHIEPPKYKTATAKNGVQCWKDWAESTRRIIYGEIQRLKTDISRVSEGSDAYVNMNRRVDYLSGINGRLSLFYNNVDESWLFSEVTGYGGEVKAWEFKPTWLLPSLTEHYFFQHCEKFIYFSATYPPMNVFAQQLGLRAEDIDYIELPGAFPVERRKVVLNPVGDLSYKTFDDDVDKVVREVSSIIDKHPNEKGVVHTVNWRLNDLVMGIGNKRLVTHTSTNKIEVLDMFMESDEPLVFVSPSSTRGIDLEYDRCRFQIIVKSPFQSLSDKQVKSRVYGGRIGQIWYSSDAAQEIVQACGRSNRHKDDFSVIYVLDKQAIRLILSNRALFPNYWIEALDV